MSREEIVNEIDKTEKMLEGIYAYYMGPHFSTLPLEEKITSLKEQLRELDNLEKV